MRLGIRRLGKAGEVAISVLATTAYYRHCIFLHYFDSQELGSEENGSGLDHISMHGPPIPSHSTKKFSVDWGGTHGNDARGEMGGMTTTTLVHLRWKSTFLAGANFPFNLFSIFFFSHLLPEGGGGLWEDGSRL